MDIRLIFFILKTVNINFEEPVNYKKKIPIK